jgi:hypothetical protein
MSRLVTLHGGPCDGRRVHVDDEQSVVQVIVDDGHGDLIPYGPGYDQAPPAAEVAIYREMRVSLPARPPFGRARETAVFVPHTWEPQELLDHINNHGHTLWDEIG